MRLTALPRRAPVTVLALLAVLCATRPARAQGAPEDNELPLGTPPVVAPPVSGPPPPAEPPPAERAKAGVAHPPPEDALIDAQMRRSWDEGASRTFVSTLLDVGWVYLRPRLSVGYGTPFKTWFGFDVNPIITGDGLGAYGGLRLAFPRFNVRVGPRFFGSFNRNYLTPQRSYNRVDLDSTVGNPSRVLTLEAEVEASVPLGPGDIVLLGSTSYVTNVPTDQLVFEETLRLIVAPPFVWRGRGGYLFHFGSQDQHSVGVVADVLDVPKRDDSLTVRVGPIVRVVLSRRVEVRGTFVPAIVSPDHLGILAGDFTELGFRYRWATE